MSFRRSLAALVAAASAYGRRSAKRCVRAALIEDLSVIGPSPDPDLGSIVGHGQEPMRVQALGAKATVERRYDGGVGQLAQ